MADRGGDRELGGVGGADRHERNDLVSGWKRRGFETSLMGVIACEHRGRKTERILWDRAFDCRVVREWAAQTACRQTGVIVRPEVLDGLRGPFASRATRLTARGLMERNAKRDQAAARAAVIADVFEGLFGKRVAGRHDKQREPRGVELLRIGEVGHGELFDGQKGREGADADRTGQAVILADAGEVGIDEDANSSPWRRAGPAWCDRAALPLGQRRGEPCDISRPLAREIPRFCGVTGQVVEFVWPALCLDQLEVALPHDLPAGKPPEQGFMRLASGSVH